MAQVSSTKQAERLGEFNKLIPELHIFLNHIHDNEPLSATSKKGCVEFIGRLESILKPPSLPPRSGRVSTASTPTEPPDDGYLTKEEIESAVISPENLDKLRELSRSASLWKTDDKPLLPPKPSPSQIKLKSDAAAQQRQQSIDKPTKESVSESIYERIGSLSSNDVKTEEPGQSSPSVQDDVSPPPVPERTNRSNARSKSPAFSGVQVVDLPQPLYSGLLRNVGSNIKQWCVIKHQKLFLFNDLYEPAAFVLDLTKYEVIKDPCELHVFRVTQHNEPSIILAAVDEGQYELWHDAFKRAKLMNLPEEKSSQAYLSLPGSSAFDEGDGENDYIKPEEVLSRTRSPEDIYVAMGHVISPRALSPPTYETMESIRNALDYRQMDLPPTPGELLDTGESGSAPPLPARTRLGEVNPIDEEVSDSDVESLNSSCESLVEVRSDTELDKSRERETTGQSWNYTMDKNTHKGMKSKEVEFLRDLSATYCGVLHQRRMLAVWQKRFCKVKNQTLLCYRTPDATEPVLSLALQDGFHLDRAEEAWRSFAFKIFKDGVDVFYFAAVTHAEQIRWLNVLAKAIDKDKFASSSKLDSARKSQIGLDLDVNSSGDSFDSSESINLVVTADDDESDEGDVDSDGDDGSRLRPLKNKHLHPARKAQRRKKRARAESFEDPDAEMQGFLYKKLKNHWSKRWCTIKEKKFLSFKNGPKELPEAAILLEYAALTTPSGGEDSASQSFYMFKLTYESEQSVIFRTRREEEVERWTTSLKKYIGSTSEERFPYINVPPTPENTRKNFQESPEYTKIPDDPSTPTLTPSSNHSFASSASPITPSSFTTNDTDFLPLSIGRTRSQAPSWSETEIEDSYINGKLIELQICNHSFLHVERFVIITKEKWLKVYEAINSTTPILNFNALDIQVKEETGADAAVLNLLLGKSQREILLKASDKQDCDAWKSAFDKIHYEDIDDVADGSASRPRSHSTENDISRLGQGTASKTMPNLGKRKKQAKETKERDAISKTKSLQPQTPDAAYSSQPPRRRGRAISTLIRSFTIDTLGRKAKNKSYELPKEPFREDDIVLKETQHGIIKQVLDKDGSEVYEERFCRIRGKIFQCFYEESDIKPIFKIPVKNAAIEDFANPGTALFRFTITAFDTGHDYTFALDNERELDSWMAALYGDDQLHKSLENSPVVPRRVSGSTFYSPASPISIRASLGSKDSFTEEDEEETNAADEKRMRALTETFTVIEKVQERSTEDLSLIEETSNAGDTNTGDELSLRSDVISLRSDVVSVTDDPEEVPDGPISESSLSLSSVTTSRSATSEYDGQRTPTKSPAAVKLKPFLDEPIKFSSLMFEISNSDMSQTKSKRWVVLRKTVLELYKSEHEKHPLKIINLLKADLCESSDGDKDRCRIELKMDDDGSKFCLVAPDENTRNNFVTNIKKLSRSLKRQKNPRNSVSHIMRRLGSGDKLKELKSKKDKRISMLLVEDDVAVIEKYEETADPSNMMSGVLFEYFDESKSSKEKERYCWIQNGIFHIAKIAKTKPIRSIDLSTVVILDESELDKGKNAFKLEYTNQNGRRSHVRLRALDEMLADKWMVSVSMGILYHRLSGPGQQRDSYIDKETPVQGDFEFVSLSAEPDNTEEAGHPKPKLKVTVDLSLREEIALKLGREDRDSLVMVREMLKDEADGNEERTPSTTGDVEVPSPSNVQPPTLVIEKPKLDTRLSHLGEDDDHVFHEGVSADLSFELLEHIPEKDNAEESFRNIKGILRQQESIRRTILKNQREKRVPPPVKPKPSKLIKRKPTFTSDTVVREPGTMEKLSLNKLHEYGEQLESEKRALSKCVKSMTSLLSEAVVHQENDDGSSTSSESNVSEVEHKTLLSDLKTLQGRLTLVEKELRACRIQITRTVASKGMGVLSPEIAKRTGSGRSTPSSQNRSDAEEEKSDHQNDQLREQPGRRDLDDDHVDSIII